MVGGARRKFFVGDVVRMRKKHPCGEDRWEVLRTGMDFRLRCLGCGRIVMLARRPFEKGVKEIVDEAELRGGGPPGGGGAAP